MKLLPRCAIQTVVLGLIFTGACVWWYVRTDLFLFALAAGGALLFTPVVVRNDILGVRNGTEDPRGISTIVGDISSRGSRVFLLVVVAVLIARTSYSLISERTLFPSETYSADPGPVSLLMLAAISIAFTIWVTNVVEKVLLGAVSLLFASNGLHALLLEYYSPEGAITALAEFLWMLNLLAQLVLAALVLLMAFPGKMVRRERKDGA